MRKTIFITLVLLCTSCAAYPTNEVVEAPENEAEALDVVSYILYDHTGHSIDWSGIPVIWMEGPCLNVDDFHELSCVKGITYSKRGGRDIEVYLVRETTISASKLMHESIHVLSAQVTGAKDVYHSAPIWGRVEALNSRLERWEDSL